MARLNKHSLSSQEDIISSSQSVELKGLLSGVDNSSFSEDEEAKLSPLCDSRGNLFSTRPARIVVAISALLGLVFGVFYWCSTPPSSARALHFNGDTLRSNGTHEFRRTVLLVSIDGLRDVLFGVHSFHRR